MAKWWVAIPLGFAGLIALLTKKGEKPVSTGYHYTVEHWRSYVEPLCKAARVSLPFAMGWIAVESGGNPCAWGSANAKGPDGHPREQGIGQLYNPDDFQRYEIPSGALRTYCIPGTQSCSRMLNDDEMKFQAAKLIDLITHCREVAGAASAKNGLHWSGKDMYKLTKLVHGLPGLVKTGIARVTTKLGRAPHDWQEFKAVVNETKLDEGTERYRSLFPRLFLNAEKVTASIPDDVKIVS
jgi:hypothetical protein